MKKLLLFLIGIAHACLLFSMVDGPKFGSIVLQKTLMKKSQRTLSRFGNFEHLVHTMKESDGLAVGKLVAVEKIMHDPHYAFYYSAGRTNCRKINLYKQCENGLWRLVGQTVFAPHTKKNYTLKLLCVMPSEQKSHLGTFLFFYTINVVRQLMCAFRYCNLVWYAVPLLLPDGDSAAYLADQEHLNHFYFDLGGTLIDEKFNQFAWTGPSLKPFELISAQSAVDEKTESCSEISSVPRRRRRKLEER